MSNFEEGYDYAVRLLGSEIATQKGARYISSIDKEVEELVENLLNKQSNKKSIDFLSGDIAEEYHAGTFNIDAAVKRADNRAIVCHSTDYASPDIKLKTGEEFSLKYYANGEKSAKAQSVTHREYAKRNGSNSKAGQLIEQGQDPNEPIYKGMKRVIPEGQKVEAEQFLKEISATESARRPEQVPRYKDTKDNLATKVEKDEVQSMGLSREDSKELTREIKEGKIDFEKWGISTRKALLDNSSQILKTSLKAGVSAATVAVALKVAPVIISSIEQLVRSGEIDLEALKTGGADAMSSGAVSFVSGATSASLVEVLKSGMINEAFKDVSPSVIGAATVVLMDAIKGSIKVANGSMSKFEFADSLAQNTVSVAFATMGGVLAQNLIPIPVLSYLIGSLVGSIVGGYTYEAGNKIFISLCIERGMTFFGLVEQNYELPIETLKAIGVEVFEYEKLEYELFEYERFENDRFEHDRFELERFTLESVDGAPFRFEFPRRGVIVAGKVGYIC